MEMGEGSVQENTQVNVDQVICEHVKQSEYTQSRFDILEGYEFIETKCIKCHKMLRLKIRKFGEKTLQDLTLYE
jgi:hypothetical protein